MYRFLPLTALLALSACATPQWELQTADGGVISYNPMVRDTAAEMMSAHCGGRGYEVVATRPYRRIGTTSIPTMDSFRCGSH